MGIFKKVAEPSQGKVGIRTLRLFIFSLQRSLGAAVNFSRNHDTNFVAPISS